MNATIINALSAMVILAAPACFAIVGEKPEVNEPTRHKTGSVDWGVSFGGLALQ